MRLEQPLILRWLLFFISVLYGWIIAFAFGKHQYVHFSPSWLRTLIRAVTIRLQSPNISGIVRVKGDSVKTTPSTEIYYFLKVARIFEQAEITINQIPKY